jgi:hypothetical protein
MLKMHCMTVAVGMKTMETYNYVSPFSDLPVLKSEMKTTYLGLKSVK